LRLVPLLIILMWAGLLWSRALLSSSMIVLFVFALAFYARQGWQTIRSSLWLKGMLLLFLIPLLTFFWSTDKQQWLNAVQVKIPLLLMPFLIPVFRLVSREIAIKLLAALCVLVLLSSFYSYWHFFSDTGVQADYLKAKVARVVMSNDHVRYAWLLVIAYAWLLYEMLRGGIQGKWKVAGYAFLVYIAIFIHVLAAKTGILGFYMVSLFAVFGPVARRFRLASLVFLFLIPLIAWVLFPSFQNRTRFVIWDFQNYSRGNYVAGLSDAPRIVSFRAGSSLVTSFPLTGVGSGDLRAETWKWYDNHAPYLKDYERLLPSNEVLMYTVAAGLLAGIISLIVFMTPFLMKGYRSNMLWISFHAISFAGLMYEIGLEVQHGVFLYIFFSCWFYARLSTAVATDTVSHT
jgi:O-antigen ligase